MLSGVWTWHAASRAAWRSSTVCAPSPWGGSVARGCADPYSDLEMLLVWEEQPTDAVRHAIVADLGATFLYGCNGPAHEDNLLLDGLQVDFWHNTVAHEEAVLDAVLDAVLEGYSTDEGDSNFLDTVRACVPLHGHEVLARWKERARGYPDELAARVISRHIDGFWSGHLEVHAHRDNPTAYYAALCALQEHLFWVLLALNREYYPTLKWLYAYLERMTVAPPDAEARLRRTFSAPAHEASDEMARLMGETLSLVEERFPQVDTGPARRRLAARRTPLYPPGVS
jgi:hypothetical protein